MPTCRTEMIFISNLRATFCAKHDFKVTKRTHAIKLLCKNVVETFSSKDFFSILLTKYFLILEQFFRFWNIFLDSEIFFSILKFFSRFRNIFLDFNFFFSRFHNFFLTMKYFCGFQNFFLDYESFLSILKVISRWRLSATILWSITVELVCLKICRQLSGFSNNSIRVYPIKLTKRHAWSQEQYFSKHCCLDICRCALNISRSIASYIFIACF